MKEELDELKQFVSVCLDEIVNLKKENEAIRNDLNATVKVTMDFMNAQQETSEAVYKQISSIIRKLNINEISINNLKYEALDPRNNGKLLFPNILPIEDTLDMILNHKASMARFGDGEFAIMAMKDRQKFQTVDEKLSKRLKEVVQVDDGRFIVAIADNYGSLDKYNAEGKQGIRYYMTDEVRQEHARFLDKNRTYHNAYISRPYALLADNKSDAPAKRFAALKRIWDRRDVLFVEGAETRLGVGNDLFDNAISIRRIVAPAINSFSKYDEILNATLQYASKGDLILIALGPTAGVLAYDLYCEGYQALDIGHMDLEYEYMLGGTGGRCEVKGKYNNEYLNGDIVEAVCDPIYEAQIIAKCL